MPHTLRFGRFVSSRGAVEVQQTSLSHFLGQEGAKLTSCQGRHVVVVVVTWSFHSPNPLDTSPIASRLYCCWSSTQWTIVLPPPAPPRLAAHRAAVAGSEQSIVFNNARNSYIWPDIKCARVAVKINNPRYFSYCKHISTGFYVVVAAATGSGVGGVRVSWPRNTPWEGWREVIVGAGG